MTLESRDVIILVTWSKFYISKMLRQQDYKLQSLQTAYSWNLEIYTFLTMGQSFW